MEDFDAIVNAWASHWKELSAALFAFIEDSIYSPTLLANVDVTVYIYTIHNVF